MIPPTTASTTPLTTASTTSLGITAGETPVPITNDSIATGLLCDRLRSWCGVHLDQSKAYLINNRLRELMAQYKLSDLATLVRLADEATGTRIRDLIVDALTTHETLFFRDQSPFDALATVIVPEVRARSPLRTPRLRIWSAACSSGQEPYSIAMKLLESVPEIATWDVSILATDVSAGTIAKAKTGLYQQHEVRRGVTAALQSKYFEARGSDLLIKPVVRNMVQFQVGNLNANIQPAGPFDLIFCRNVLIYFQPDDVQRILKSIASRLKPDGRLFVGCSEMVRGTGDFLVSDRAGQATCYRPK